MHMAKTAQEIVEEVEALDNEVIHVEALAAMDRVGKPSGFPHTAKETVGAFMFAREMALKYGTVLQFRFDGVAYTVQFFNLSDIDFREALVEITKPAALRTMAVASLALHRFLSQ